MASIGTRGTLICTEQTAGFKTKEVPLQDLSRIETYDQIYDQEQQNLRITIFNR
jgi:hypothetical protein